MPEPTNASRAARAKAALDAYAGFYGEVGDDGDITDLLSDLHHYLRSMKDSSPAETMDEALQTALMHFETEEREAKWSSAPISSD